MTSSTSSSTRRLVSAAVALAVGVQLGGCAHGRAEAEGPVGRPQTKVALFPIANLTGAGVEAASLSIAIETALRGRGIDLVAGDIVETFLARHRVRYVAGIEAGIAKAARDELGVEGVLLTTVELYSPATPPQLSLTMRFVSASDPPQVLWADGVSRAADDSPGFLGLGMLGSLEQVEAKALPALAISLASFLDGKAPRAGRCPVEKRFNPRASFRASFLHAGRPSIAVLPFVNSTSRRDAGDVLSVQFVRQLAATGEFDVLDPGLVREELIAHRITMEGGVSLDTARVMFGTLRADYIVSGTVREYEDRSFANGSVRVDFTAVVLDRVRNEIVWSSTSSNSGTDDVRFFGVGTIKTATALACRMVSSVIEGIVGEGLRAELTDSANVAPAG